MVDTSKALNIIGKPYHNDANLIAYAFEYAQTQPLQNRWNAINEYVHNNASDKRYVVKCRASDSSVSSAIIEYRHKRYYVYGVYNPISHNRTFYVEYAYR